MYRSTLCLTICIFLSMSAAAQQWTSSDPNSPDVPITRTGNVGIGTTSTAEKLNVSGNIRLLGGLRQVTLGNGQGVRDPGSPDLDLFSALLFNGNIRFFTGGSSSGTTLAERVRIDNAGKVGIGTNSPMSLLHLAGPAGATILTVDTPGVEKLRMQSLPGLPNVGLFSMNSSYTFPNGWALDQPSINGWFFKLDGRGNQPDALNGFWVYRVPLGSGYHTDEYAAFGVTNGHAYFRDNVGIGTTSAPTEKLQVAGNILASGNIHATGDIRADHTIFAKYQDVAEWVPSVGDVPPATVVVIVGGVTNVVTASNEAYNTRVAGVVSAQPGIVLGEGGGSKVKVATTGRVKVKVDATRAPIHAGDILVTSGKAGMAMKSEPIDIGGVKIHRPGTVVGKALESLDSGTGEILVLLTLQ